MQDLTEKQRYWKSHLDALEMFEGSAAEYARLHDVSVKKLYVYKTQIRRFAESSEMTTGFLKVTTSSNVSSPVTVSLPNGVRLSLPDVNAPGFLERLARL